MWNKKAVIISDDQKSQVEIEQILAAIGHESVVVRDPLLAVDVIVQNRPDVIFMELKMPHKNGFELAEEINHVFETRRIPIIGMSQFFKHEFKFLLDLCGINRCVVKPLNALDVIWAVENVSTEVGLRPMLPSESLGTTQKVINRLTKLTD